ncbi:MAG: PAS domain-containing protein [Burkholderiales bacterium]|nr:PAS domain-containing protein [Burkholderiales bacterium]
MAFAPPVHQPESAPTVGHHGGRGSLLALSQRKLNALGLPIAYVDRHQRYRFANRAFLEWLDRREDEVVGREVVEVVGRDLFQIYRAYVEAALAGERTGYERQLVTSGRPPMWVRVDYYPDRTTQGHVRGYLVTYLDIDHVKRLELEAGQREHRLRVVTDSVGLPILYFDRQLKVRFANKPFGHWLGLPADDVLGHGLREVLPGSAFAEMEPYTARALAGASVTYERRELRRVGDPRWTRITLFPDREAGSRVSGVFVVMTDIEEDIRIRDALKAQGAQMRLFADNIPGPVAYLDRNLRYTFVNQAFANSVNKAQDAIYGRRPVDVMPPDVATFLRSILERAMAGEQVEYERVGTPAQGVRRWLHGRVVPDFDDARSVRGLYCTEYDIHDLKLAEQALAAREEQLRLFNDNIPEPIVYLSADHRYQFVNDAFLRLAGLTRDDVIGKAADEVVAPQVAGMLEPARNRAFPAESITYERAVRDASGHERWIRAHCVPDLHFDGTVKGEYIVGHDITDLKQAQDALAAREGQLRAIMDGVPAPVAYIDRDERCQYVNRSFLLFFGLTPEQVAVLRLREVVGHGIYQSAQAMLTRAMEGESTAFDRLVTGAHGVRRWMTIRVVPDASPGGEVYGAFVLMNDIHGLKQAQEALRDSEAQMRLIMDNVPARVSYIDRDYRYRFFNRHNEEWLGEGRHALTGRTFTEVLGSERAGQLEPVLERVLEGETVTTERELTQPDGQLRWESIHYAPHRDAEGNVVGIYAMHADIHDQKRNEEELRRVNWMLSSHINNTPLAVLEWDRDLRLVRWSPQAENIFGWRSDEVLGVPLTASPIVHDADRSEFTTQVSRLIEQHEPRATGVTRNQRRDGKTIWCEWYHSALLDHDGDPVSILSFVQDVSSRVEAEERLQYLATRDALTGLPNRLLLQERLAAAIAHAKRHAHRVGVLFIDLDRFKNVNDTLGHRIGDELLKKVTASLSAALRASDLLARLGGDEFMVIVEDFEQRSALGRVAEKLQGAITQPFEVEGHEIFVTASIGIAAYPDDADDPEELMKHADVAMYRSKDLSGNTYQYIDEHLAEDRRRQHSLETALRAALAEEALSLHYQPVLRIADGAVVGAEALLRWSDPTHGGVPPNMFIPLAEESGLIHALGEWVLRSAARQCVEWRRDGLELTVSVNLSARQFYRDDLAVRIREIVREEACEPSWLKLEVTETSLLHDLDAIEKVLRQLRDEGFGVAIDDFGTGYSSLTHLKRFPIDTLKIDISFIADLETDPQDAAITKAIISLAGGLDLQVVAEGVGTHAQLEFLAACGCDYFQGYFASEALPVTAFGAFVRAHRV